MNQSSTIYWSHLKMYEECPQKFLWTKGWDDIELGRGPGKGKKRPDDRSRHHAVMGIVTQFAVEAMYNEELWRDPQNLSTKMVELIEKEWKRQLADPRNIIDYNEAGPEEDMIEICRQGAVGYLQTMKHHRFLGVYAKAEVDLLGWIDKWNPIGGRADTIVRRDDTGVTIIDGKNTKHKMKYTDPDQLRWYALLFKLSYRQLPDRLAYVWYRFPHGMPATDEDGEDTIETGVEWIDFTEEDLKGLAQRAVDARQGMRKRKFEPTPTPTNCRFCDFEPQCEARQSQRKANAANRKPRASSKVPELDGAGGIVDLSL